MSNDSNKPLLPKKASLEDPDGKRFEDFRPSEFMRARRPHLYSDSKSDLEILLTSEMLGYHLETLTNRKQEIEFEHFCRRLVEKEICPNLIPQTGPTGGGDSKVDTETYPVDPQISMRWYVGREASQERWAFAFSAKKEWRSKVRSDVAGIVGADRGYKLIYFVSNQYVPDKARASVEDELREKYHTDIRIFDRSWILKCIFENDRLQLAIETLNIAGVMKPRKIIGPHDVEREKELIELESQIEDVDRYVGVSYQLAEDCLEAALLARGLELPRVDVMGRFLRAEEIARTVGIKAQCLRIAYNRAWTVYWWYDDFDELNKLYDEVEGLISGTAHANELELLVNLWQLLHTTVKRQKLTSSTANLVDRTKKLKAELNRVSKDSSRPNNALLARTDRLLIDLNEALTQGGLIDSILEELKDILVASEGLAEFPADTIMQIVREIGDILAGNEKYDELFELVVALTEKRASQGEAGLALLQRGYQKLNAKKNYDAIRFLGRAQQKLALEEYRKQWVIALVGCGLAYEAAGLLWAARSNFLVATSLLLSDYVNHGDIPAELIGCFQKMVWLELQIGRVPNVLAWIEISSIIFSQLKLSDSEKDPIIDERNTQDIVLGMLLLKTDFWELKWLDFLPGLLDNLELYHSRMALLFALGYEDFLRSEGSIPATESTESVISYFAKWLNQPANADIPEKPEFTYSDTVLLRSNVLGCEVVVNAANSRTSILLGETILGALEALLATSLGGELMPYQPEFSINIRFSDSIQGLPQYEVIDHEHRLVIQHGLIIPKTSPDEKKKFLSWLQEFTLTVTFQIATTDDPESFAAKNFRDEMGLSRAFNFSDVTVPLENIFGPNLRNSLSDWRSYAEGSQRFPPIRVLPWQHGVKLVERDEQYNEEPLQFAEGDPPENLFGLDNLKHKDRKILSLINIPLWDKAKWQGTAYLFPPGDNPPILALAYSEPEFGKKIFVELRDKVGEVDENEQLRIAIITGVDKQKPNSYKIVISTNPKAMKTSHGKQFMFVTRVNQMDPVDIQYLNHFLDSYHRIGRYVVMPTQFISATEIPQPFFDLWIGKRELHVRPAWEIGQNDLDVSAIGEDDNPIIPKDVINAPVLSALRRFGTRKRRKRNK